MFDHVTRRDWLKCAAAGVLGTGVAPWFRVLAAQAQNAAQAGTRHKSCILLWMSGGPAQTLTFDLKTGGPYREIQTAVPGIRISEHLPKIAEQMRDMTLLRGMKTNEAAHANATYLM